MKKLPLSFYNRPDVAAIAKELLGKSLVTCIDGLQTSGYIVETEAYTAFTDQASHAWKGKRTMRNEHMYAAGGTSYVYICYGMHHMMNVVTNKSSIPDAVLIRALEPCSGIDIMLERTGKKKPDYSLTRGPGNLARAMGITKELGGYKLNSAQIYIGLPKQTILAPDAIGISKRIGIDGAGRAIEYPLRFYIKGNAYVSGSPKN